MVKLLEKKDGWEKYKFEELFGYTKGKKPSKLGNKEEENYLPYLSTEYLRNNGEKKFAQVTPDLAMVEDGEIILLWDGSNAGEFFKGKKGILSSTMVKLITKKESDKDYLFYVLKSKENFIRGQTKGTGIPHVDGTVLKALEIPFPALPEQKRIAEILSTVDKKLDLEKERKEKLERIKKGLMNELLTGKKRVNVERILEVGR